MATGISAIESYLKGSGGAGGTTGRYLSYLILGDGETKTIRFLTDEPELHVAQFHEFVLDRNGKFQTFVVAPSFYADDRDWRGEDWVLKYGGKTTDYTTKELVDPTPRQRIVGLAVEREEFPTEVDGRRVLSTRDLLTQIEGRDGRKHDARNFLIVKQGKPFWTTLVGYFHEFGTLCDRDYKITRTGKGLDINYSIIPKNPDPGWNNDGSSLRELHARYGYGTGRDVDGNEITVDSEDRFLYCTQTLDDWMRNQASEERARQALVGDSAPAPTADPGRATVGAGRGWSSAAPDEPAASAASADVSSLRERLERHR